MNISKLYSSQTVTDFSPLYFQLKSDLDKQDGNLKYILTGEGAGSLFVIDEYNGKIYVIQKLDREKKPFYTLRAEAINRSTQLPVEPESEFIIKVRDVNDNEPQFLDGPYVATVPEMSPEGIIFSDSNHLFPDFYLHSCVEIKFYSIFYRLHLHKKEANCFQFAFSKGLEIYKSIFLTWRL